MTDSINDKKNYLACDYEKCLNKNNDAFLRCSSCHCSYYCNKLCQKLDWKLGHKEYCKEIKRHSLQNIENKLLAKKYDLCIRKSPSIKRQ
jgi:hypothetical protein